VIAAHVEERVVLIQEYDNKQKHINNELVRLTKVTSALEDTIKQRDTQIRIQRDTLEENARKLVTLDRENKNLKTQAQQKQKVVDELQVKLNIEVKRNEKHERSKSSLVRSIRERYVYSFEFLLTHV
jgi:chromosome segregation ATPase